MIILFRAFILTLTIIFFPLAVYAVPTWKIVPEASKITFTATQNNAPVTGEFKKFNTDINFDIDKLNASKVNVVVDVDSVTTSYSDVATTLKSKEWFDSKTYPHAVFKTNHFIKTGKGIYQANGTLTIRDKTAPVTLTFIFEEYAPTKAKVKGSTTFKRTQFGVGQGEWAKTNLVKDEVKVEFLLTAVKK